MNTITILGNIGRDPELRQTNSGKKFYTFSVASKAKKDQTTWFSCVMWEFNDKFMSYLKSGSSVVIQGVLQSPRVYQGKDGEYKCSPEVNVNTINFSPFSSSERKQESQMSEGSAVTAPAFDEDLPF